MSYGVAMIDTGKQTTGRRFPIGAEITGERVVSFRVWADKRARVEVVLEPPPGSGQPALSRELIREPGGYFSGSIDCAAGTLYRFRLDGEDRLYPDPASRCQPYGPHGPSRVIDPTAYRWKDSEWTGASGEGRVIYELHIGTFTHEGTWRAAEEQLEELARCGVTIIEHMPVAEFPGRFGWGYDGVDLFAPTHLYGSPDDFRSFIDTAHCAGIAVILDVVYNHFGPDGNYLPAFSDRYFTDAYKNEWGQAINFDGPGSEQVREFFVTNARYWIDEFHLDGLRLDATQSMLDASPEHIIAPIVRAVRKSAGARRTVVIAENEPQDANMAKPQDEGGYGVDALWNDDFHHSIMVAVTGRREGYYTDYLGSPQEFISMVKWGYLYQGQYYLWQKTPRGTPSYMLPPSAFVLYIENHDQVANSCCGYRLHQLVGPSIVRAITALLLLAPGTPMLFQGQEFGASAPFLYFADFPDYLAGDVAAGRKAFLSQFPSLADHESQVMTPDSCGITTFARSKLDLSERTSHGSIYTFHKDLLRLRKEDPVFSARQSGGVEGAVLGNNAFLLRFFGDDNNDRLLTINLGIDLHLSPAPEPLLAPPARKQWGLMWSSEDHRYGGLGTPPIDTTRAWTMPGRTALVFMPVKTGEEK